MENRIFPSGEFMFRERFYKNLPALYTAMINKTDDLIPYINTITEDFWVCSESLRFATPEDCLLQYTDTRSGTKVPLSPNLFDSIFLSWIITQFCTSYNKKSSFINRYSALLGAIQKEQHTRSKDRRKTSPSLELVAIAKSSFTWCSFAERAKMDLLCRTLNFQKGNNSQLFHPFTQGAYFFPEFEDETFSEKMIPIRSFASPKIPFKLEDYFFYEYCSGASLSIELTECLMKLDKTVANSILKALKPKLLEVLPSQMLLTRVFVLRLYILEAWGEIEYLKNHFNATCMMDNAEIESAIERAFIRVDNATRGLLYCIGDADAPYDCEKDYTSNEAYKYIFAPIGPSIRDKQNLPLYQNCLQRIKHPVDIMCYMENPIYGPVAFCHKNHFSKSTILSEIEESRKSRTEAPKRSQRRQDFYLREIQKIVWNANILRETARLWTHADEYLSDINPFPIESCPSQKTQNLYNSRIIKVKSE